MRSLIVYSALAVLFVCAAADFTCCVQQNQKQPQFKGVYCTNCICEGIGGWKQTYSFTTYDCYWCGNYSDEWNPTREEDMGAHFSEPPQSDEEADEFRVHGVSKMEEDLDGEVNDACGPYICCYYTKAEHDYLEPTICVNQKNTAGPCESIFEGATYEGQWQDGTLENECYFVYREFG